MKIIFQSTSNQPVLSETNAKDIERKIQRSIVFMTILFLVVLIFEIKLILYLGLMCSFIYSTQS